MITNGTRNKYVKIPFKTQPSAEQGAKVRSSFTEHWWPYTNSILVIHQDIRNQFSQKITWRTNSEHLLFHTKSSCIVILTCSMFRCPCLFHRIWLWVPRNGFFSNVGRFYFYLNLILCQVIEWSILDVTKWIKVSKNLLYSVSNFHHFHKLHE